MGAKQANSTSRNPAIERRRTARKTVLETFQVFLVIPQKGFRRIHLKDLSEGGIGFYAEDGDEYQGGESVPCYFYINPSLKLPLLLKVAHTTVEKHDEVVRRKVGCEFGDQTSKAYKAYALFINMLDELSSFVET